MNREEAKAKIAKLMAMGNCTTANEHEAEAALRQASFLMRKHAIEQAEIADSTGTAQCFDWSTVSIPINPKGVAKSAVMWLGTVAVAVARFTDTKVSYNRIYPCGMCIKIEGEVVDVEYAAWLLKNLRDTVRAVSGRYPGTRSDRELFRHGMVARLVARMQALKEEATEELRATVTSQGTALVIQDRKLTELEAHFGEAKYSKRRAGPSTGSRSAYAAGDSAGKRVNLNKQVPQQRQALAG